VGCGASRHRPLSIFDATHSWSSVRKSAPVTVASVLVATFAAPALLMFLAAPALFGQLDFAKLMLLASSIGSPILLLCIGFYYAPAFLWRNRDLIRTPPDRTGASVVREDDDLLWGATWHGSNFAHLLLFGLAAWAYYHPIRLGASLLLMAAILAVITGCVTGWALWNVMRRRIQEIPDEGDYELLGSPNWLGRLLARFLIREDRPPRQQ